MGGKRIKTPSNIEMLETMYNGGKKMSEIAECIGCDLRTVYKMARDLKEAGKLTSRKKEQYERSATAICRYFTDSLREPSAQSQCSLPQG